MNERRIYKIEVRNKEAKLIEPYEPLVGGNNDYDIVFDFDSDWEGIEAKTAVFGFGEKAIKVPFVGNVCKGIPVYNTQLCGIGVFAGDIKTSTVAWLKCELSAQDLGDFDELTPNLYEELMKLINDTMERSLPIGGKQGYILAKKSDSDYDSEWVLPAEPVAKQDSFHYIKVQGQSGEITPDKEQDTLTLIGGRHISLYASESTDSVNISVVDKVNAIYDTSISDKWVIVNLGNNPNVVIPFDVEVGVQDPAYQYAYATLRHYYEVELRTDADEGYTYRNIVVKSDNVHALAYFDNEGKMLYISNTPLYSISSDVMFFSVETDPLYKDMFSVTDNLPIGLIQIDVTVSATEGMVDEKIDKTKLEIGKMFESVNNEVDKIDVRVTNIENHINPKYFVTDTTAAYDKLISANACPYIELNSFGGSYARQSKNLLDPYLFTNATINDDGWVYCPVGSPLNSNSFTLPAGTYTISSAGDPITVSGTGIITEGVGNPYNEHTFQVEENNSILVTIAGDYGGGDKYSAIMLNEGTGALPYENYYKYAPIKVNSIQSYGANLVDDVALFESFGFTKQANGYWLGTQKLKTIFENTEGKSGTISISYKGRMLTTSSENNSPFVILVKYTDSTNKYILSLLSNNYTTQKATTDAAKTVQEITYMYGTSGTYEVKDLIINWGGVAPYQPYSAEPIAVYEIPEKIKNLPGYGFGTVDLDNKKLIQDFSENGALTEPIVTDIADKIGDFNNIFKVQAGGVLRFVNEAKASIPNSITYLAREDSI